MINQRYISEWSHHVLWKTNEQVEQDLVICRALVENVNSIISKELKGCLVYEQNLIDKILL